MIQLQLNGKTILSKIYIEEEIRKRAAEFCLKSEPAVNAGTQMGGPSKVCVVTDTNVAPVYLDDIVNSFRTSGIPVSSHVIKAGEEYKTLETVSQIYDTLGKEGFGRNDMLIALGGGVTGDITGFVAATYLRGLKYLVQIPTTLLAQVDSSVGGKCGVDLPHGKNLAGAIRQPDIVLVDPMVLNTLPEEVFSAGMAEVVKYGCIRNRDILDRIAARPKGRELKELIADCIRIKIEVVEEDETEEGLRRILNFGHTIGHAVERLGNYTAFSHGEAVAMGMAAAVKMGEAIGVTEKGTGERLADLLRLCKLPSALPYPVQDLYEALLSDKKKEGGSIRFIYIEKFGTIKIIKTPVEELREIMKVLGV